MSEDTWAKIEEAMLNEPIICLQFQELLTCLKKNVVDPSKMNITKNHIAWKNFKYPGIVKLSEKMFIVPLVDDAERALTSVKPEETKANIKIPVRSLECTHSEVFDLFAFLKGIMEPNRCKCLICEKPIKLTSLYVDTRIYHVLKGFDKAVVAVFPNSLVKGYDPDMAKPLTVEDITKINMEQLSATMVFSPPHDKGNPAKTNIQFIVPSFLLSPFEYDAKEQAAKFKLTNLTKDTIPNLLSNVKLLII